MKLGVSDGRNFYDKLVETTNLLVHELKAL
jgi:hypothetical protein